MPLVNRALREALSSDVALIGAVADHIIGSGGKRLRPAVLILSARACGYEGELHHRLAAIVEMIHTSTLLHDDVVDDSSQRRGRPTANEAFGNAAPVLAGDFLYSRAFQMIVATKSQKMMEILSNATNVLAEGEVQQLMHAGNPDLDEAGYTQVIERKTATLFEASARLGAVCANAPTEVEEALTNYGCHLGRAFQIMDDLLDYVGDPAATGKNLGDDLAEGKMTLPLIRAMAVGTKEDAAAIRRAVEERSLHATGHDGRDEFIPLIDILNRTDAFDYTHRRAKEEAALAVSWLKKIPASSNEKDAEARQTLIELCAFAVDRAF